LVETHQLPSASIFVLWIAANGITQLAFELNAFFLKGRSMDHAQKSFCHGFKSLAKHETITD
jgi:hypothetical protein